MKQAAQVAGLEVSRYRKNAIGKNPFLDMKRFIQTESDICIFDVGANIGQSIEEFRSFFPTASIYSFEPSPSTFCKLREKSKGIPNVTTWNLGVGSEEGVLSFQENEHSVMSSFLSQGSSSWGQIVRTTAVEVITLDSFCAKHNIDYINILKSDTQGFDFEVFKGSKKLMQDNRIELIYFEFIFSDMYKSLPSFHDVFRYLTDNGFSLVTFYSPHFQNDLISWTDALFVNQETIRTRTSRSVK